MKIGIAVMCTRCQKMKQPHGRDASGHLSYCDDGCEGYYKEPLPGCLWPGENSEDFSYSICSNATRDV